MTTVGMVSTSSDRSRAHWAIDAGFAVLRYTGAGTIIGPMRA